MKDQCEVTSCPMAGQANVRADGQRPVQKCSQEKSPQRQESSGLIAELGSNGSMALFLGLSVCTGCY